MPKSITLHLLPGALIGAVYYSVGPILFSNGYPPIPALLLAILVVLAPFELFIVFRHAWILNRSLSLRGVVVFRDHLAFWKIGLWSLGLVLWNLGLFTVLSAHGEYVAHTLFSWLPGWALPPGGGLRSIQGYPHGMAVITLQCGLVLNGLVAPIVEEIYFKGYLLPRIPAKSRLAPLVSTVLFSLYHFASPWAFIPRALGVAAVAYLVSCKRNIYIGIVAHVALNTIGMLQVWPK